MSRKEVNFKSKLIEWSQKNKVEVSFELIEQFSTRTTIPSSIPKCSSKAFRRQGRRLLEEGVTAKRRPGCHQEAERRQGLPRPGRRCTRTETPAQRGSRLTRRPAACTSPETYPHAPPLHHQVVVGSHQFQPPGDLVQRHRRYGIAVQCHHAPNCPVATSSAACPPMRVERLRSNAVGDPPRCT